MAKAVTEIEKLFESFCKQWELEYTSDPKAMAYLLPRFALHIAVQPYRIPQEVSGLDNAIAIQGMHAMLVWHQLMMYAYEKGRNSQLNVRTDNVKTLIDDKVREAIKGVKEDIASTIAKALLGKDIEDLED